LGRQSQAWLSSGLSKASALPKSRWTSRPARRLQCQQNTHPSGSCGGVSGRPMQVAKGSDPPSTCVAHGGKHPGLPEHVSLRGRACKSRPWLVRLRRCGAPPRPMTRTSDKGCSKGAEEGNVVSVAPCARNPARGAIRHRTRGRVLRSVLRPAHVHRHIQLTEPKAPEGGAPRNASPSQSRARARGKTAKGRPGWDAHGSQLGHRLPLEGGHRAIKRNGRGLRPPSCEDPKLGVVLVRRNAVAEVVVATPGLK